MLVNEPGSFTRGRSLAAIRWAAEVSDHIQVGEVDGHVVVTIDDYELFDYVADFLTEECDLEHDYHTSTFENGREVFSMHFPHGASSDRISAAIAELPREEIERIWRLNNSL